jgi:hypothetical protein
LRLILSSLLRRLFLPLRRLFLALGRLSLPRRFLPLLAALRLALSLAGGFPVTLARLLALLALLLLRPVRALVALRLAGSVPVALALLLALLALLLLRPVRPLVALRLAGSALVALALRLALLALHLARRGTVLSRRASGSARAARPRGLIALLGRCDGHARQQRCGTDQESFPHRAVVLVVAPRGAGYRPCKPTGQPGSRFLTTKLA